MEILQIKSIVPDLVVVGRSVLLFANFEFDGQNGGPNNENRINAAGQPRHIELEIDRSRNILQGSVENFDLLLPRTPLFEFYIMAVRLNQSSRNIDGILRKKRLHRRAIIRGNPTLGCFIPHGPHYRVLAMIISTAKWR